MNSSDRPTTDTKLDGEPAGAPVTDEATTAPGDLPLSEVEARIASLRRQFRHDNTIVPQAPAPDLPVEVWATSGEELRIEQGAVHYTIDGQMPTLSSPAVSMEVAAVDWDPQTGYLTRWRATLPAQPAGTIVRYRIAGRRVETIPGAAEAPIVWAHDGQGFWFRYPGALGITTFAYRVEPADGGMPDWACDAVIYQIFLDRFHPGTPDGAFPSDRGPRELHGGTLAGVQQALPYLDDLGVTCLWLSPFCASPSYHRYDATDYFAVDPALGTNEDLRALTRAAHARGMRVMMDFVPSHCSWEHPAFRAAQRDPHAPTATWFTFDERPDHYRSFLNAVPSLPSFNTDDPGARAYLLDSAVYWLHDYGIDAFRLDHAIGPSMDFWVAFRAATRAASSEVFSVGEVTDTPDALRRYRHRLDAVLDFPLARALRRTFALGDWDLGAFDGFLEAYSRYMASGPGRVSFLDNHDMNRFLFMAGGDVRRLKLAALCLCTLEPTPALYYGTEIALSQAQDIAAHGFGGDAAARGDMPWDRRHWNQDVLAYFRALIRLRREQPALRRGARRTEHLDAPHGTYMYRRWLPEQGAGGGDDVLTLFNLSDHARQVELPGAPRGRRYVRLLATDEATGERAAVTLAPWTGAAYGPR